MTTGEGAGQSTPPLFTGPIRQIFYWRMNTPKASRALITLRHFNCGTIVSVRSLPTSHHTFSEDFKYAFAQLCGDYDLQPTSTACYEEFFDKDKLNLYHKKYIELRLTDGLVSREILMERDFYHLINRLKQGDHG
ncbi:hypothetical protein [Coleofasciculus sp. F4-SAH-05]|uniref:hypothetical protein n=1 Tax=Coleofasciculus sp. F4-SAH-05 TaxID=3069525 RepID=UPI0032F0ADB5